MLVNYQYKNQSHVKRPHGKWGGTIFTMCSHTFILFWLRKTSVIVKMFQLSFCVCVCVYAWARVCTFHPEISLFFSVRVSSFYSFYFCAMSCCFIKDKLADQDKLKWLKWEQKELNSYYKNSRGNPGNRSYIYFKVTHGIQDFLNSQRPLTIWRRHRQTHSKNEIQFLCKSHRVRSRD